jgi:hypothetical protein
MEAASFFGIASGKWFFSLPDFVCNDKKDTADSRLENTKKDLSSCS